jgi:hypothetical protein
MTCTLLKSKSKEIRLTKRNKTILCILDKDIKTLLTFFNLIVSFLSKRTCWDNTDTNKRNNFKMLMNRFFKELRKSILGNLIRKTIVIKAIRTFIKSLLWIFKDNIKDWWRLISNSKFTINFNYEESSRMIKGKRKEMKNNDITSKYTGI